VKFSIAVPSFNYGRYIGACLESIRTQDYPDFEVLVADGGSRDGSMAVIDHYCGADSRFRLVSRSDAGQSDAVQKALLLSSGDIQCFLNADDCYLSTSVFSRVVEVFRSRPDIDVVTLQGWFVDEGGRRIRRVRYRYHPLDSMKLMKQRTIVLQPATFWRRRVWENSGFRPDFHFVFDVAFFYEAYLRYSWLELPDEVAGYRWHGENKSAQISPARIAELAEFEHLKYGRSSWRGGYLAAVAKVVRVMDQLPAGVVLKRAVRLLVNGLAFLTVYRLPGI